MLQTTNNVFNNSLLKYVTPNALLAWHRVRLANVMAHSGEEWADIYARYNSGVTSLLVLKGWPHHGEWLLASYLSHQGNSSS